MEEHIKKLIEATKNPTVRYSLAYNDGPDIGIRGVFKKDPRIQVLGENTSDCVIIDNIPYLIAGDIYEKETHKRVTSIHDIIYRYYEPQNIYVMLRAQAIVCGKIIQITLGKKFIYSISYGSVDGMMELLDID